MTREPTRFLPFPTLIKRRPTKVQIVALAIITLLCLGPIAALVAVISRPATPVELLTDRLDKEPNQLGVTAKVRSVSPTSGTAEVRLTVHPPFSMVDDSGLTEPLLLRVNDTEGVNLVRFGPGQPIRPIDVVVGLEGQSVERYPFDEYTFTLIFKVERILDPGDVPDDSEAEIGADAELEAVPMIIEATTEANDYSLEITDSSSPLDLEVEAIAIDYEVRRPLTTVLWVVGVMGLMWGLAIVGAMIAWAFVMWGIEFPMWAVGYYLGVLFAMPPLRNSLPGEPPPGTLLDFVAFYWAVGIIVVTLMTIIGTWLQRSRAERPALVMPVSDPDLDEALAKVVAAATGATPAISTRHEIVGPRLDVAPVDDGPRWSDAPDEASTQASTQASGDDKSPAEDD